MMAGARDARRRISEGLGRLYEVAFNTGALTALSRAGLEGDPLRHYREDMRRWRLGGAVELMLRNARVVDPGFSEVVRHAAEYLSVKGYVGGLLFLEEYLKRIKPNRYSKAEVLYFGCDFDGENNFGQWMNSEGRSARERALEDLLGRELEGWEISRWKGAGGKGEFLQADCLALFRTGRKKGEYHVLSVDFSAFSGGSLLHSDVAGVETQRRLLAREVSAMRAKSVFSGMHIDTGGPGSPSAGTLTSAVHLPEGLRDYFGAFKYGDKEFTKFVQAGSYAHSFYEALLEEGRLSPEERVRFTAVGHSDRDAVSISVSEQERGLLGTCHTVYKEHDGKKSLDAKRRKVLALIAENAATAFGNGRGFVDGILDLPGSAPDDGRPAACARMRAVHRERIDAFKRPQDTLPAPLAKRLGLSGGLQIRKAHQSLVRRALAPDSEERYVFLTGAPGIGKTTSLVSFLREHQDEGFLFLYVSPRKQVNRDVVAKFAEDDPPEGLLCLNSNREVVEEGGSGLTVEFRAEGVLRDDLRARGTVSGVRFLDADRQKTHARGRKDATARHDINTISAVQRSGAGVLQSVFRGVGAALENDLSRTVVATAAVQALRRTRSGTTLRHLPEVFRSVLRDGSEPIPEKMRELASRVKHIFVMVDEITGDSAGAEFLASLGGQLEDLGLADGRYGFNTKIIVADASIVDKNVIEQHLAEALAEPDKIFFRAAAASAAEPLTMGKFRYRGRHPAAIINANCYPASALEVAYKVRCEAAPFDPSRPPDKRELARRTLEDIADEVVDLLRGRSDRPGQVLVYIQDKARLAQLIDLVRARRAARGETFEKPRDYIEIHANLPVREERAVERHKESASVVFMTSSASRGLSFKKARHILVEIPRFSLEQNLMELIQVIYRGRGDDAVDATEKALTFYVSESVFYDRGADRDDREAAIREGAMNLLAFLLVLKTAIMTRMVGAGRIGGKNFLMVPVGGKSVSYGGESFSGEITAFLGALSSEIRRDPRRGHSLQKEVYEPLHRLFSKGSYGVGRSPWVSGAKAFRSRFLDRAGRGLEELLERPPLQEAGLGSGACAVGSLLIVPCEESDWLQEEYAFRAAHRIGRQSVEKLRDRLWAIRRSEDYPEELRYRCAAPLEIVEELLGEASGRSQRFTQSTGRPDRYYALPLSLYVFGEQLEEYFRLLRNADGRLPSEGEREGAAFRALLEGYVRSFFPLDGVLPVGYEYEAFPFLLFNSYNLRELRSKLFAEKQMFASNELNILNLILAAEP